MSPSKIEVNKKEVTEMKCSVLELAAAHSPKLREALRRLISHISCWF